MKKIRFPFERIIGFLFYGIAAVYVIRGMCTGFGMSNLFVGSFYFIIGMVCDPKSDLYNQKKK